MQQPLFQAAMAPKPQLHPGVALPEALRETARRMIAHARAVIAAPAESDTLAVHEFRREMKRWRAFLRLLQPLLGAVGARLRTEARDLARALASARNARSALDALADLGEEALSARSRASIAARLDALREAAEGVSLTPELRGQIDAALAAAAAAVEHWPVQAVDFADLAARLAEGYRRARRTIPKDWSAAPAEEVHALRQRVVVHRYQMELIEPLWPRFGRFWVAEAQRLRDRLGHFQDLEMLAALTAPHQPLAPWRSRLTPLIAARQAEHLRAAARLAGRLFAESPRGFRRRLLALWDLQARA
jgi:CHAD domain-containing protein